MSTDFGNEFSIEGLQPSWLLDQDIKILYKPLNIVLTGFIFAGTLGLLLSLFFGLIVGLIGLAAGFFLGLFVAFNSRFGETITLVETLKWSWKKFGSNFREGFKLGLSFSYYLSRILRQPDSYYWSFPGQIVLFLHVVVWGIWSFISLLFGIVCGGFIGLGMALAGGISGGLEFEKKVFPNEGIWLSLDNLLKLLLIWLLIGATGSGLIFTLIFGSASIIDGVSVGIVFGVMVGLLTGLERGGKACIQHFTLRLLLYLDGRIPWNYAQFLDYCTERLFLQCVGGRYRFIHRLVQEHFEAMPLDGE
jgi:hypothetical protein